MFPKSDGRLARPLTGLLALSVLLLSACASAATNTTTSGIYGQVLIGPTCPVEQPDQPCPDQPYQATITVLDQNRNHVTRFQTDALGNFKLGLKPGTYILAPESTTNLPFAVEQTVTVPNGLFIKVDITFDSGIR